MKKNFKLSVFIEKNFIKKIFFVNCFSLIFLFNPLVFANNESFKNLQKIPKTNDNSYIHSNTLKNFNPALDFQFKSSLALTKNKLLKTPYHWSVAIPYTEMEWHYNFSKKNSIKVSLDLSYQSENWIYSIDDLSFQQEILLLTPVLLKTGYFYYPISYSVHNEKDFFKPTLTQKTLFPVKERSLGLSFKGALPQSFYWQFSLHPSFNKRETDLVQKLETHPVTTISLIYNQTGKDFFVSYFQKKFFLEGQMQSLGLGSNLSFKKGFWSFNVRGEFWGIKKTKPHQNLLTYYLSPYLQWQRFSLQFLFGGVHHYLQTDQNYALEYLVKAGFRLTDFLFFNIEWLKEQDTLIKEEKLILSLKTVF